MAVADDERSAYRPAADLGGGRPDDSKFVRLSFFDSIRIGYNVKANSLFGIVALCALCGGGCAKTRAALTAQDEAPQPSTARAVESRKLLAERRNAKPSSPAVDEDESVAERSSDRVVPASHADPALPATPPPAPPAGGEAAPGDEPPRVSAGFTLAALQQLALQHNPTLAMADAEIQKQRGVWTQVGLKPNPTVGYLRTDPSKSSGTQTEGAFVQQQFITGGKLGLNRAVEAHGIQNMGWMRDAQIRRIENDVRIRYYEALGAQEKIRVAEQMVQTAEEGLKVTRDLLEAKIGARPDVLQAEIQLSLFRTSLQQARAEHAAAWQHLADMTGLPDLQPSPLAGRLDERIPELNREASWQQLLAANGLLRSVETQVQIARSTLVREEAEPIPDVTVQFVGEVDHTNDYNQFSTLVALPLPLFNRNQGGIRTAERDIVRACREVERTMLVLQDQFATSFSEYGAARAAHLRLRDDVLPKAEENLRLSAQAYKSGEFDLLRVLTARQTYFDVSQAHVAALTRLQTSAAEIEGLQLTGGLNPAMIGSAIQGGAEAGEQRRAIQGLLDQQNKGSLNLFNPGTTNQ